LTRGKVLRLLFILINIVKKLFLITPYSIDSDFEIKKKIISKICQSNNIELYLAEDKLIHKSLDANETIELFKIMDYFIADISYQRPSCYFEIGYLQALNKEINLIAKTNTPIHQLLKKGTVNFYQNINEFKGLINDIIRKL